MGYNGEEEYMVKNEDLVIAVVFIVIIGLLVIVGTWLQ